MEQLADSVWILDSSPRYGVNTYLINDILVDAGTRYDQKTILSQLEGIDLSTHVLTHGHADHQGASRAVCETFDVPLWCGEADADAVTSGDVGSLVPDTLFTRAVIRPLGKLLVAGPACTVKRRLHEGDVVGEFTVVETPGHTPGHISFWRERDRTLILGDTLFGMNLFTRRPGLREPFPFGTANIEQNRKSAHKVAQLHPELVCFGHGPPLRDPDLLSEFVASLS